MKKNNLLIIQARTGSSRLPNKVLKCLSGKPMLLQIVLRVKECKKISRFIVATTNSKGDDAIEILCKENNVLCYRGSENDVLDRFYQAAKSYKPDNVIRVTADCPLIDARLIDDIIAIHESGNYDYTSNTLVETYPDGLDTEVFKFAALERAWKEANLASEREHVTPYIKFKDGFKRFSVERSPSLADKRWTVDTERDFQVIERIYNALYENNRYFGTEDILKYLEMNPELEKINADIMRNEGYKKSIENDYVVKGEN